MAASMRGASGSGPKAMQEEEEEEDEEDDDEDERAGESLLTIAGSTGPLLSAVERLLPAEPVGMTARRLWELRQPADSDATFEEAPQEDRSAAAREAKKRLHRNAMVAAAKALMRPIRVDIRMSTGFDFQGTTQLETGTSTTGDESDGLASRSGPGEVAGTSLTTDARGRAERLKGYLATAIANSESEKARSRARKETAKQYGIGSGSKEQVGARFPGEQEGALGMPVALLRCCGPVRTSGAALMLPTAAGNKRVTQHLSRVTVTFVPDLTREQAAAEIDGALSNKSDSESLDLSAIAAGIDAVAASVTGRIVLQCHYVTRVTATGGKSAADADASLDALLGLKSSKGKGTDMDSGNTSASSSSSRYQRIKVSGSSSRRGGDEDEDEDEDEDGGTTPVAMRLDFGRAMETPPTAA